MSDQNEVIGLVVMSVNGQEIEITSMATTETGGWKPVATMNRETRTRKKARVSRGWTLQVTAVIPKIEDGRIPERISDARITVTDPDSGQLLETYIDCSETSRGKRYQVDGEAVVDISLFALDYQGES